MAVRRSIDFLPEIFKTQTNRRFLNATVDQLIQEPKMTRMSSFIGRSEGSPVYKDGDAYIQENDELAQYYQLEPATVVRQRLYGLDKEYKISNVYNYLDMLNKISSQGGIVNNHDRLFNSDYYNYTGFVDFEKLVNYSQYYWVPSGPDAVSIFAGEVEVRNTFFVNRPQPTQVAGTDYSNIITGSPSYRLSGFPGQSNPTITLVRGGRYVFEVAQEGYPFYIQTEPGTNEASAFQQNISIREVKGVQNNGETNGQIIFNVPKATDQDEFIELLEADAIDFVTDIPYNQIQNVPVDIFYQNNTFDGVRRIELNKLVVLTDTNEDNWFEPGTYSEGDTEGYDDRKFDQGDLVPREKRAGIWLITLDENNILNLVYQRDFDINTKIFVREGSTYGNRYIYKDSIGDIKVVPNITSQLDTLYYQDGINPDIYGIIKLVEPGPAATINVNDILGAKNYTSPNGIQFTNGLKIKFNNLVTPESYLEGEYIVEGVGTGIKLTKWQDLVTPEKYTVSLGSGYDATGEEFDTTNYDSTLNSPNSKEYIVINRSSRDANPWSRVNRWFHKDVLNYTASILTPGIGYNFLEESRAKRPIIEFNSDLLLFNSGWNFLTTVDAIDVTQNDAFSNIEGTSEYFVDNVRLLNNVSVVFMNDSDPTIRKQIYKVQRIDIQGNGILVNHLVPYKMAENGSTIIATSGVDRQGIWYYWNEDQLSWVQCQQKTSINQSPYFDVASKSNNISFGDRTVYTSSNFQGSKLFSFKENTRGTIDSELGIRLTYKTIGNIGDIVFENNFDTDTFVYSVNSKDTTVKINTGNAVEIIDGVRYRRNPWKKIEDKTKQYIERKFTADVNTRNRFDLNMLFVNSTTEKNIFVYVNGVEVTDFSLLGNNDTTLIQFTSDLTVNDRLLVRAYGLPNDLRPIYTVPKNLEKNSQNNTFETITLGQMRNHLIEIAKNSLEFAGEPAGNNNLRDIDYTAIGGNLLQHSGSFFIAQLLTNHPQLNVIDAINYSRREYNRFKEQLFDLLENTQFQDITDSRDILDTIMGQITGLADSNKPFYYTDMMPYGRDYVKTSYTVFNPADRTYNTNNLYDYDIDTSFYQNILIYLNKRQLIKGKDYTLAGRVVTLLDECVIAQDDLLEFYEYNTTKGCMIPATPSKLGLYPACIPTKYEDDTIIDENVESKNVIQGHDGSITIAFNDFRDDVILEFERRIYNTIKVYNNENSILNYKNVEPGAFRDTEYSFNEWTQLLSSTFLDWAGTNNVEIFSNTTQSNNLFSFNYAEATDKLFGELLPGYWRAIYKYFYDTDRPHTHPWEMLGYSNEPLWWQNRYGAAPYTSGNLVLWEDLEQGLDFTDALNPVVKPNFIRPGLTRIIPVDEHGNLLSPQDTIVARFNKLKGTNKWRFGDQGPAESAWRRSSDYPFSVMIAYALAKPVEFCTYAYNTRDYQFDSLLQQVINTETNNRKFVTDYTDDNQNIPGVNVYIRDRLSSLGLDININQKNILDDATINLAYKMAGYTDKQYIKILAEQTSPGSKNTSVLIPETNYDVVLTKSAPVFRTTYSAVIIEKSATGYIVTGFDTVKPYFKVIPSLINKNSYAVKVGNEAATVYKDSDDKIIVIPYGTELTSKQQVVDFLISYGRFLESQGFRFEDYLKDKATNKDWILSVKEFLFWTQQAWDEKTILSVTPAGSTVKYNNGISVVDDISNSFNGTRVIDNSGQTLSKKDYRVYREGTQFELDANDTNLGIHLLDIEAVQYEHTLVFDNITQFNDIIFEPNLGNRQLRLKITGSKTADWNGSLYAPGFLVNHKPFELWTMMQDYYKGDLVKHKNKFYTASKFIPGSDKFDQNEWLEIEDTLLDKKLIPNLAFNAQQFEKFYDVDSIDINTSADSASRKVTGFQQRKYFTDIGLDVVSQHKFYLGMIAEKGTKANIDKFLRAKLPYVDNDIEINEEYAFKIGSYGDINNKNIVEMPLSKIKLSNKIAVLEFLDKNDSRSNLWNTFKTSDLSYIPATYNKNIFAKTTETKQKIKDAGYVKLNEIVATVFDVNKINNISNLSGVMGEGSRIWVASDIDNDWDIYRVSNDQGLATTFVSPITDNEVTFTTTKPHGLNVRDKILLKRAFVTAIGNVNQTVNISGVYRVVAVTDNSFNVQVSIPQISAGPVKAVVFKLHSIRYDSRKEFATDKPYRGWKNDDIVYVDNVNGKWQVLKNVNVWEKYDVLSPLNVTENDDFGSASALSYDERYFIVSSSEDNGRVYIYGKDDFNNWSITESIIPLDTYGAAFGTSLAFDENNSMVVGSPATDSNQGAVYVGKIDTGAFEFTQVIYDATLSSGSGFGQKVALSRNGEWLYISRPNDEEVDAYKFITVPTDSLSFTGDGSTTDFDVPSSVFSAGLVPEQLKVFVDGILLIPYVEYNVNVGSTKVTLVTAPDVDSIIKVEYSDYYLYIDTLTNAGLAGNNFGIDITTSTDGRYITVGASNQDVTISGETFSSMGSVYVYERSAEKFIGDGSTSAFTTYYTPNTESVYIDDTLATDIVLSVNGTDVSLNYSVVGNVVTFFYVDPDTLTNVAYAPEVSAIIKIETNSFTLEQQIIPENLQDNMAFGTSVKVCPTNCSLYIGSPEYYTQAGDSGAVYRYVNVGRLYGTKKGTISNPTVTPGDVIRINDFQVTFTGTSLDDVVADINTANIPGVTASITDDNTIIITTDSQLTFNKLLIASDSGTGIEDLGIEPYEYIQRMDSPYTENLSRFGENVLTNPSGDQIVVGTTKASSVLDMIIDSGSTTFDRSITIFKDVVRRSGAAYLYEYQPSQAEVYNDAGLFAYATKIVDSNVKTSDAFSTSVAFGKNWLMIASPKYTINNQSKGAVIQYYNSTGNTVWQTIRSQPADVDSNKITRAFIYNKATNRIEVELPVIDSAAGKVHPDVQEQINFTTNYDPAAYNVVPSSTSFTFDKRSAWGKEKVGTLWWDTNALKYINWNQENLNIRAAYKDLLFPSSSINIYQWVESLVPPSAFSINNVDGLLRPLYTVNNVYSQFIDVDDNGNTVTKYYFWAKLNRNDTEFNRNNNSIQYVSNALTNLRGTGLPYIGVIATNAVALYNCEQYIGADHVLKIEYNKNQETQLPVHTEWSIFNDGSRLGFAEEVYKKIQDSFAAQDSQGRIVPDMSLTNGQKYGLDIRPRQTIFKNVISARKLFHDFANDFFEQYPVAILRDIQQFTQQDPYPDATLYDDAVNNDIELSYLNQADYINKTILVKQDGLTGGWTLRKLITVVEAGTTAYLWDIVKAQTYNNNLYWDYSDWYAYGFNEKTIPTYQVDFGYEIQNLQLKANDTIKILNSTAGGWQLIKVTSDSLELVGQQNATIKFRTSVYSTVDAGFGIDDNSFEAQGFDRDNAIELRNLFDAFVQMLIANAGVYVDEFRKVYKDFIDQYINLITTQFVETDWLFKTSFISIKQQVGNLDQIPVYSKTNDTVVQEYINEIKPYHAKIRQYLNVYKGIDTADFNATDFDLPPYFNVTDAAYRSPELGNSKDDVAFTQSPYTDWLSNYKYFIESIDIINPGAGYTNDSVIVITGGGGFGAKARLKVKANGVISNIIIIDQGADYLETPEVTIEGPGSGAILRARLGNNKVRTFKTTVKFDRYTYTNTIQDWQPLTSYNVDDLFVYNNIPYRVISAFTSGLSIDLSNVIFYKWYNWKPNTKYLAGDLIVKDWANEEYYEVLEDFTSGNLFNDDLGYLAVYTGAILDNAADRIWSHYSPASGAPGRVLGQLMSGIEYPGVRILGQQFEQSPGFGVSNYDKTLYDDFEITSDGQVVLSQGTIDTIYYSEFLDTALGTRPEDIISDGAGFVDTYNSHAPEELVPGRVFDTLDIKVTTLPQLSSTDIYAPDLNLTGYYEFGGTTFAFKTDVTGTVEKIYVYTDRRGHFVENEDYTIDWIEKTITLTDPNGLLENELLYILSMGSTGLGIVEDLEFIGDGSTTTYEVANQKEGFVQQVYVKVDGNKVEDYELIFNDFGRAYVVFDTAPDENSYIQIHAYNLDSSVTAYSAVKEISYTVAGNNGEGSPVAFPDAYIFNLPNEMQYAEPFDSLISVKINGEELASANNAYYTADGSTTQYAIPSTSLSSDATISNNDIVVVVDLQKQQFGIDYTLLRDGSSLPVVQFFTAPYEGASIVISDSSIADYRVVDGNKVFIKERLTINGGQLTNLVEGDKVVISQFSNQDMYDLETKIYIGLLTETVLNNGFDIFGFDSTGFDSITANVFSSPIYQIWRPVNKYDNLWVYRNGQRLHYLYDYTVDNFNRLIINQSLAVTSSDVIMVRHFSEQIRLANLQYRIFKNMNDNVEYLGIGRKFTTELAQDLLITDSEIVVKDSSKLSTPGIAANQPGVIFVNGERITYWEKDDSTNTLSRIRRATAGTGAPAVHAKNSRVEDGSTSVYIPDGNKLMYELVSGGQIGLDGSTLVVKTSGSGLQASNTLAVNFLKSLEK